MRLILKTSGANDRETINKNYFSRINPKFHDRKKTVFGGTSYEQKPHFHPDNCSHHLPDRHGRLHKYVERPCPATGHAGAQLSGRIVQRNSRKARSGQRGFTGIPGIRIR
jgi:hypothetical protein